MGNVGSYDDAMQTGHGESSDYSLDVNLLHKALGSRYSDLTMMSSRIYWVPYAFLT